MLKLENSIYRETVLAKLYYEHEAIFNSKKKKQISQFLMYSVTANERFTCDSPMETQDGQHSVTWQTPSYLSSNGLCTQIEPVLCAESVSISFNLSQPNSTSRLWSSVIRHCDEECANFFPGIRYFERTAYHLNLPTTALSAPSKWLAHLFHESVMISQQRQEKARPNLKRNV